MPSGATAVPSRATAVPRGVTAVPSRATAVPSGGTAVPSRATVEPSRATAVPTAVPSAGFAECREEEVVVGVHGRFLLVGGEHAEFWIMLVGLRTHFFEEIVRPHGDVQV